MARAGDLKRCAGCGTVCWAWVRRREAESDFFSSLSSPSPQAGDPICRTSQGCMRVMAHSHANLGE